MKEQRDPRSPAASVASFAAAPSGVERVAESFSEERKRRIKNRPVKIRSLFALDRRRRVRCLVVGHEGLRFEVYSLRRRG